MERLNKQSQLPARVAMPAYQPEEHGIGIVHFGLGAFQRGHMAVYNDSLLAAQGGDWRVCGVSLRSPAVRDRLQPQDCRYSLVERSAAGEKLRIIGSVAEVLVAPQEPATVFARLLDPAVSIVSLTITEKGYLRDPASGALIADHADIQHDLAHPQTPLTVHGFITEALAQRRAQGLPPLTLLSCDNLPHNGRSLQRVICEFARLRDVELAQWIEQTIAFPSTMVDRIVPATTEADIAQVDQQLGLHDAAPVLCEAFSQWVVEDNFSSPRPAWEDFGVTFVADVAPFEEMKLRLLNGSHSAIAYLGYLGGYETVDQVISDEDYLTFVQGLMAESRATLSMPEGVDLVGYCAELIERFRNPSLKHRTGQIAMDGSLKLPQRLLDPARQLIAAGQPFAHQALAIAAWLRYVSGVGEQGQAIEVSDPYADKLRAIAEGCQGDLPRYLTEMLKVDEIFGSDLATNEVFYQTVLASLEQLYAVGAKQALCKVNQQSQRI